MDQSQHHNKKTLDITSFQIWCNGRDPTSLMKFSCQNIKSGSDQTSMSKYSL